MDNLKREDVLVVYDKQANNSLIEKLKAFKSYINDDLPEWKQLIMIGGFVADVVKELKWSEKPVYSSYIDSSNWNYKDKHIMTCDEICDDISTAIDHHLSEPFADELNAMWQDWHFNDTGKYADVKTSFDMIDILVERIEQEYPGLGNMIEKYFLSDKGNSERK